MIVPYSYIDVIGAIMITMDICSNLHASDCNLCIVSIRDVPGKEREKTGTRKKRERNAFFPFPFLHFWAPVFFPVSGQNHKKRMKNKAERPKNGRKDVERRRTAVPRHSKL